MIGNFLRKKTVGFKIWDKLHLGAVVFQAMTSFEVSDERRLRLQILVEAAHARGLEVKKTCFFEDRNWCNIWNHSDILEY